jgi:hypothetical protein
MIAGVARVSSADKLVHAEFHTPPRVTVKTAVLVHRLVATIGLGPEMGTRGERVSRRPRASAVARGVSKTPLVDPARCVGEVQRWCPFKGAASQLCNP